MDELYGLQPGDSHSLPPQGQETVSANQEQVDLKEREWIQGYYKGMSKTQEAAWDYRQKYIRFRSNKSTVYVHMCTYV